MAIRDFHGTFGLIEARSPTGERAASRGLRRPKQVKISQLAPCESKGRFNARPGEQWLASGGLECKTTARRQNAADCNFRRNERCKLLEADFLNFEIPAHC